MKRLSVSFFCYVILCIPSASFAQTAALEKAEKRLVDLLAPGGGIAPGTFTTQPGLWKTSRAVEEITLPIRPYTGATVRLPRAPGKEVKPRSVPEAQPLVSYREQPAVPKAVELPTKPLIRLPSLDVHTPLPIPILAQPVKDRASLGDPALEASLDAALKRFTPTRDRPVPFMALNLPDPFEYVRAGQLRNPPEENPTPPVIPLRMPTK